MLEEDGKVSIIFDEDNDSSVGCDKTAKIYTEQGDPEIDGLYQRNKRGRLNIQPDFQRYFVWDIKKSSRLIESVLLDIPLPVIYLSEEQDGTIYVIDGQQRLTSFFSFIDGFMPNKKVVFKLSGLKVLTQYEGKQYSDLSEDIQDKIRYSKVRTITFKKESDKDLKFEIFERLNTGSVPLNAQELRNCIYRGKFNSLLKELAENETFLQLLGYNKPNDRMKDVELVLRFSAFYHNSYLNYKGPIKNFLNNECIRFQHISDKDSEDLRKAFKNAVSIIYSMFGNNSFKRYYIGTVSDRDGYWEKSKLNISLFDILMDSFARVDKNLAYQNLDAIKEAFIDLVSTDKDFIDAIEKGTSEERKVTSRFMKWNNILSNILTGQKKQKRCFSLELKTLLFNQNSTCAICKNKIQNIDDAALDHIEQYWLGGKTIPENARLTHRFCNMSRQRKESLS